MQLDDEKLSDWVDWSEGYSKKRRKVNFQNDLMVDLLLYNPFDFIYHTFILGHSLIAAPQGASSIIWDLAKKMSPLSSLLSTNKKKEKPAQGLKPFFLNCLKVHMCPGIFLAD